MKNVSLVRRMMWKDFELHRTQLVVMTIWGAAALATLLIRREAMMVVGSVVFFIALILTGCLLPASNLLNERKKQTLPFMMSLPISFTDYTTAKLLGTVVMFLISWVTLAIAAIWMILVKGVLPHGAIPVALILLLLPFVGLSVITGMTLVGDSEGWSIAANVVCNSSYGLVWYFIMTTPSLMAGSKNPAPIWNHAVVTFLLSEVTVIVVMLALTYYLQSRKRDFV